jgi:hypothetical protein
LFFAKEKKILNDYFNYIKEENQTKMIQVMRRQESMYREFFWYIIQEVRIP